MKFSTTTRVVLNRISAQSCHRHDSIRGFSSLVVTAVALFTVLANTPLRSQPPFSTDITGIPVQSRFLVYPPIELGLESTSKSICSLSSTFMGMDFMPEMPDNLCSDVPEIDFSADDHSQERLVVEMMMKSAEQITRNAAGNRFPDQEVDSMIGHVRELILTTEGPTITPSENEEVIELNW